MPAFFMARTHWDHYPGKQKNTCKANKHKANKRKSLNLAKVNTWQQRNCENKKELPAFLQSVGAARKITPKKYRGSVEELPENSNLTAATGKKNERKKHSWST
jgi:hypothetical protein